MLLWICIYLIAFSLISLIFPYFSLALVSIIVIKKLRSVWVEDKSLGEFFSELATALIIYIRIFPCSWIRIRDYHINGRGGDNTGGVGDSGGSGGGGPPVNPGPSGGDDSTQGGASSSASSDEYPLELKLVVKDKPFNYIEVYKSLNPHPIKIFYRNILVKGNPGYGQLTP